MQWRQIVFYCKLAEFSVGFSADSGSCFSGRSYFCQRPEQSHSIQGERNPALQVSVVESTVARMGSVKEETLSVHGTLNKGHRCVLTHCI